MRVGRMASEGSEKLLYFELCWRNADHCSYDNLSYRPYLSPYLQVMPFAEICTNCLVSRSICLFAFLLSIALKLEKCLR